MKIQILTILLFVMLGSEKQTIEETFIVKVVHSNAWFLKFDKNEQYKFYRQNGHKTKILSRGKYEFKDNVLTFQILMENPDGVITLPSKLFYANVSEYKFTDFGKQRFAYRSKKSLFMDRYIVLSETKLNTN